MGMTLLTLSGCKKKDVSFADSNDSRVWLIVSSDKEQRYPIAKEATINAVIQTKNGKCLTLKTSSNDFTLEKIANMNDTEIVSKAEDLDQEQFNDIKKYGLDNYDYTLQSGNKELGELKQSEYYNYHKQKIEMIEKNIEELESARKKLDDITYKTPSWENISITLKKDNNNKETIEETINLSHNELNIPSVSYEDSVEEAKYDTESGKLVLSIPVATTEVLGQYYTGYATENGKTLLITRVDKDYQKMALDKKEIN